MSEQKLSAITEALDRIETKVDSFNAGLVQHIADDESFHRALAKRQGGFVAGATAVAVAIGAALAYGVRRIFGH